MKTLKTIGLGLLVAVAIVGTYLAADYYFESKRIVELPTMKVYAGEQIEAPESTPPSLYPCVSPDKEIVYLVIATSGEFMMFDMEGVWVTNGTFVKTKTNEGIEFFKAEVGDSLLGMFNTPSGWRLAISTDKGVTQLACL